MREQVRGLRHAHVKLTSSVTHYSGYTVDTSKLYSLPSVFVLWLFYSVSVVKKAVWNHCYISISCTVFTSFERNKIFERLYMYQMQPASNGVLPGLCFRPWISLLLVFVWCPQLLQNWRYSVQRQHDRSLAILQTVTASISLLRVPNFVPQVHSLYLRVHWFHFISCPASSGLIIMIEWQFAAHISLRSSCVVHVCCCMYSMHLYVSLFLPQRNYQFDFLRKQHPLFAYFTKLVEQYSKVGGWVTMYMYLGIQHTSVCVYVFVCVHVCVSMKSQSMD